MTPAHLEDPPVLIELFAGSLAMTRYVVGAPPKLVSWLGGKMRVASVLARTLGLVRRAKLGGVLLSDAGPWGWVWPLLLDYNMREAVVAVLRYWSVTCPACEGSGQSRGGDACNVCVRSSAGPGRGPDASDLWAWLASQPPRANLAERTAGWLWLQARSASGAPVWWDGERWAQGSANGGAPQSAGERGVWLKGARPGREMEPAAEMGWSSNTLAGSGSHAPPDDPFGWRMGDKGAGEQLIVETSATNDTPKVDRRRRSGRSGVPALVAHPPVRMGDEGGNERKISQKGMTLADHNRFNRGGTTAEQCWLMSDGRGVPRPCSEKGRGTPTRARGIIHVASLANRIEGIGSASWPVPSDVMAEVVATWLVLQTGSARGRPVDLEDGRWRTVGYAHLTDTARAKGFTSRLHLPRFTDRIAVIGEPTWPSVACVHGSALDALPMALALGPRARTLLDPPYHRDGDRSRDRTGYGADLPLADTLQMAARLDDARGLVTITEGGPLARDLGPGWFSYDISSHFSGTVKGQEWVTCNRPQPFLDGPAQQRLFPVS